LAKTGIGQTIELLQQKAAQKGLENLWAIVSQTSLKAATTSAVRGLLLKLGLQVAGTVVPVIGNIAAAIISFVGPALIKRAGRRIERLTQFITSGFGLLDGILQTVSRGGFEDNLKWLTPLFIGLFVVLFFFGNKTIAFDIGSAFLGSSQGEGPWTNPELPYYPSDLQCPNPRHLSEKVACVLEGCQQTTVSFVSWNLVTDCIHDSGLPKEHQTPILEDFKNSLFVTDKNGVPIGFLQCVGFVTGIQHALTGNVIDQRNACGYCHDNTPAGYQRFPGENFDDPEEGDIAVWDGTSCGIVGSGYDYGHVAIVVQKHEDKTMTIAQANYHAPGLVDVSKNVRYGTPNEDGSASPNCFLRYTGH
jgi:surface antigen